MGGGSVIEIRSVDENTGAVVFKIECDPPTVDDWARIVQGVLTIIGFSPQHYTNYIRTTDDIEGVSAEDFDEMVKVREEEREAGYKIGFADGQAAKRKRA